MKGSGLVQTRLEFHTDRFVCGINVIAVSCSDAINNDCVELAGHCPCFPPRHNGGFRDVVFFYPGRPGFLVRFLGDWGPHALLVGVYLMTTLFAATIGNNAAAALAFPFAVGIAGQTAVSPRPFVMAVVFAASASFMSPLSYQTNLMVYGPGRYRFIDFVRVGGPLTVLLLGYAVILIPLV